MALLKDWFGWEGPYTAQLRRTEESHQDNKTKMEQFVKSEKVQRKLTRARKDYYDRGNRGDGIDPYVTGAEDLGKIGKARDALKGEFGGNELDPETAAYFDAAEQSVLDRTKSLPKANRGTDFVGPPAPSAFVGPPAPAAEFFTDDFVGPPAPLKHDRTEGSLPPKPNEGMFDRLGDYFQAPTETVPEANIPKTYQQLGISSIDDQATLQEMQSAMPDRDMRDEYEADPESMQRLMKLWKAREIDKKNLHKFFSMIQQAARQSLGIA